MEEIKNIIQDVKIIKKNQTIDDRGKILHMLRADDNNFTKFGEIYFSFVNPKKIKAWHFHKLMTLNYRGFIGDETQQLLQITINFNLSEIVRNREIL